MGKFTKAWQAVSTSIDHAWFVPLVIAFGLLIRLAVQLAFPTDLLSDAGWYAKRASEMLSGIGYQEAGHPTAFWPVGWPALLAAGKWLTGSIEWSYRLLNLVSAAGIMMLIVWAGRKLLDSEHAARIALLLYSVYPAHIAYAANAMTETTYTAIFLFAFVLIIRQAKQGCPSLAVTVMAGLLFGIATLVKPQTYLFPIGAFIGLWIVFPQLNWRRAITHLVATMVSLFIVVLPWSLRNANVLDEFYLVSTNGGSVLYYSANSEMTGQYVDLKKLYPKLSLNWDERVSHQVEHDKAFKSAAIRWIRENPLTYLGWMPTKLGMFWASDADGFWLHGYTYPDASRLILSLKVINQVFYLLVLVLSLPCLWAAIRSLMQPDHPDRQLLILTLIPVFVSLLAMVFSGITRYHYPAMPCLILMAAWTLSRLTRSR